MSGLNSASTQQRGAMLAVAAALILPSLVIDTGAAHVFWTPEALAARLLAPLALAGALVAWPSQGPWKEPRARLGLLIFGVWAAWLMLAAALSQRPRLGFDTLVEWASYPLVFAATWRVSASASARRRLVTLILVGGGIHALYALVQVMGLDPFPWSISFGGRAGGFLGNPNFLGGHLALLLPLALAWALRPGLSTQGAALTWINVGLMGFGALATQTRGAWAGAVVGLGWMFIQTKRFTPELLGARRQALNTLGAVALVAFGTAWFANPQLATRLTDVFLGRDVEVSRRLFLAGRTTRLALERPFFGVGPGQFRIHFPQVQVIGIPHDALQKQDYIVTEHAHNDWLHMAAEGGWAAAALWMALLIWFFGRAIKEPELSSADSDRALLFGGAGGLLALQVHGLANYPFLLWPTQILAWGLAALCLRALWQVPAPAPVLRSKNWPTVLTLIFAAIAGWGGIRTMFADHMWWIGEGEINLRHQQVGMTWLGKASSLAPDEDRIWALGGATLTKLSEYEAAIRADKETMRLNPYDSLSRLRLGQNLIILGKFDEAETLLVELGRYAPNLKEVWHPLAQVLFTNKKYLGAAEAYNWAIFYQQDPTNAYINQAACYGLTEDYPKALEVLDKAQILYPLNAKIQINMAITALRVGDKARAQRAYERAKKIDPEQAELGMLKKALNK